MGFAISQARERGGILGSVGDSGGVLGSVGDSSTVNGFSLFSMFDQTKDDKTPNGKVVTNIAGPVTFDDDFLMDL